jgi:hypothetical protein
VTSRPAVTVFGLAIAAALAVAACSSGATSAPSAATGSPSAAAASITPSISIPSALASALASAGTAPDAATLVTADMAASVIGGSPTKVTPPMSIPNVSLASYGTSGGDSVTVFVEAIPGGLASAQLQAAMAMAGSQGSLTPVSGIGDAAGKVVDANEATVAFVKGSNVVVISAQSGSASGSDLEPKVEALAQQVAGKM